MDQRVRPSFENLYMGLAVSVSARSTCSRLNVGCVIVSTDFRKVLSLGYNGGATGLNNCCDSDIPGACGCLHAEVNSIINCDTPRSVDKFVFVTSSPCKMCSKALINLGNVRRVYYSKEYRIRDGIELLLLAGIEAIHAPYIGH